MFIDPGQIEPAQMYKLLIGAVSPRPIAWVSSVSLDGHVNLAPFSFFTVASANPPVLCFNPLYRGTNEEKDTLANIRAQREFVVNTVSFRDLERMNLTCHDIPPDQDEFDYASIEKVESATVSPPRIANAVVSFECRLNQIVDLGDQALSGHLVLGDVVAVHVQDSALEEFRIDADQLDAIGRMAGNDYTLTRERVQLSR